MDASATLTLSLIPHVGEDPADGVARDPARSDGELMRAVAGGDPDAFALLYGRYERPLYNFLVRLTRQRALAEDLLQETFTRVCVSIRSCPEPRGRRSQNPVSSSPS